MEGYTDPHWDEVGHINQCGNNKRNVTISRKELAGQTTIGNYGAGLRPFTAASGAPGSKKLFQWYLMGTYTASRLPACKAGSFQKPTLVLQVGARHESAV